MKRKREVLLPMSSGEEDFKIRLSGGESIKSMQSCFHVRKGGEKIGGNPS